MFELPPGICELVDNIKTLPSIISVIIDDYKIGTILGKEPSSGELRFGVIFIPKLFDLQNWKVTHELLLVGN